MWEVGQEVSKEIRYFRMIQKITGRPGKAKLELERIDNNIGNKQNEIAALEKEKGVQEMMHSLTYNADSECPDGTGNRANMKEKQTGGDSEITGLHRELSGYQ